MEKRFLLLLLILLVVLANVRSAPCASMTCQGGIISEGDTRFDLSAKCGEPAAKESREDEIIERQDDGSRRKLYVTVDVWTYDFGPTQLQRIVTLKNGKIAHIRTGNYGHESNAKHEGRECSEQAVSRGDGKNDVLIQCGEPAMKDVHEEIVSERLDSGALEKRTVVVEEWTYNLGPNRFVRILTFRNGKLTDIRTGGYGY
ncbi:MAG TPA: DUF2845 domain-containing protein [Nitrospirota bacterium]|nr:DUF2845 domain-containing protein [Nitrospirota bacterium]